MLPTVQHSLSGGTSNGQTTKRFAWFSIFNGQPFNAQVEKMQAPNSKDKSKVWGDFGHDFR